MNNKMNISFCVPCCNVSKYVNDCVASIESQQLNDYGIDYEILLVDDFSDDDTLKVLYDIEDRNSNCKVFSFSERQGVSNVRNYMIEKAQGEYIWFVDSDDLIYPDCCETFIRTAQKYNADKLVFNYYETDEYVHLNEGERKFNFTEDSVKHGENFIPSAANQFGAIAGGVCMAIWKRQWILKNELRFNPKVAMKEDVLFHFQSEQYERMVVKVECPGYIYRVRPNSATTGRTDIHRKKSYVSSKEMCLIFREHLKIDTSDKMKNRMDAEASNCISSLQCIRDKKFVKTELKSLKELGFFPWKPLTRNIFLGGG